MAEFKEKFIVKKSRKKWKKIRKLRNEIKKVKEDFINEKRIYCLEKTKKIKEHGFTDVYKFFLSQKKKIIKKYNWKKNVKRVEINKFLNKEGEGLFNLSTKDK